MFGGERGTKGMLQDMWVPDRNRLTHLLFLRSWLTLRQQQVSLRLLPASGT